MRFRRIFWFFCDFGIRSGGIRFIRLAVLIPLFLLPILNAIIVVNALVELLQIGNGQWDGVEKTAKLLRVAGSGRVQLDRRPFSFRQFRQIGTRIFVAIPERVDEGDRDIKVEEENQLLNYPQPGRIGTDGLNRDAGLKPSATSLQSHISPVRGRYVVHDDGDDFGEPLLTF